MNPLEETGSTAIHIYSFRDDEPCRNKIQIRSSLHHNEKAFYKYYENGTVLFVGRKNLIRRCLNNLIDNSVKYGENIIITLKNTTNSLTINIEDDGPGIPKNEYENVFKPFYKIDKSRGDSKSSVGLGMSIASDIVQSHGGSIRLEKSNLLKGLNVRIFLPL